MFGQDIYIYIIINIILYLNLYVYINSPLMRIINNRMREELRKRKNSLSECKINH